MLNKKKEAILTILKKIISNLTYEIKEENAIIIVEGKHDSAVLKLMGIPNDKIITCSGKNLDTVLRQIEHINPTKLFLFLDRDYAGKKLHSRIYRVLTNQTNIKIVNLWDLLNVRLKKYGFKTIRKVEELKKLASLIKNQQKLNNEP